MINPVKLAILFELLFFCFGIISLLIPLLFLPLFFRVDTVHYLDNVLRNVLILLLIAFPGFIAMYIKLKNNQSHAGWRIVAILIDLVIIFKVLLFDFNSFFAILSIIFLLLSIFFGSLKEFQIIFHKKTR